MAHTRYFRVCSNSLVQAISVHELMSAMSGIRVPPSIVIQLDNLNNQIDR